MTATTNDIARTYDAWLHCSIAGWMVGAVMGGLWGKAAVLVY